MQRRAARHPVEALIFEQDVGRAQQPGGRGTPAQTLLAAHLEQIREVVVEEQRQLEVLGTIAVVLQADALIGRSAPQEYRPHDMQHVLRQHDPFLAVDVRIGEIDGEDRVVVAQVGAEQQGLHVVQQKFEPRQIASVGVEQSVGTSRGRADIAVLVENDEGIVVLQRAPRPRRRAGDRNVEGHFAHHLIDGSTDRLVDHIG